MILSANYFNEIVSIITPPPVTDNGIDNNVSFYLTRHRDDNVHYGSNDPDKFDLRVSYLIPGKNPKDRFFETLIKGVNRKEGNKVLKRISNSYSYYHKIVMLPLYSKYTNRPLFVRYIPPPFNKNLISNNVLFFLRNDSDQTRSIWVSSNTFNEKWFCEYFNQPCNLNGKIELGYQLELFQSGTKEENIRTAKEAYSNLLRFYSRTYYSTYEYPTDLSKN